LDNIDLENSTPLSDKTFMDFGDFASGIEDITMDTEKFIKMAIYGPQGVGKTSFIATCPKPLLLDFDERGSSVLVGSEVRRRQLSTFEMTQQAYWFLKNGKHDFQTVALDTTTMMETMVLNYLMNRGAEMDASKDKEMPTMRDYGSRLILMQRWILAFRNLDMNVVFIVQERKNKEDDIQNDDPTVFPDLSPKVSTYLNAAVSVVGRMYTREKSVKNGDKTDTFDEYLMRLKGNSLYKAKCRVPRGAYCPRIIKDPTFDKIRRIYMGEYKKENANG
jgi:hypothetical protein